MSAWLAALGFIGDFHPIVVHFPIALVPTAFLLKLTIWRRPIIGADRMVTALLALAFIFAGLAVCLGLTTSRVNGFSGAEVDDHARLGLATLAVLGLSLYLHRYPAAAGRVLSHLRPWVRAVVKGACRIVAVSTRGLKWLLMLLFFPVVLLFWLFRTIARRAEILKRIVSPVRRRCAALLAAVKQAIARLWCELSDRVNRVLMSVAAWQNASLLTGLILIATTGLLGADLGHGEGHLTRNMPGILQSWLGVDMNHDTNLQLDRAYFEQEVLPVFRRSCVKCHGEEKQKAGLRLDNYTALVESRVVRYQQPYSSELLKRMLLSRSDPAAMPPQGKSREVHPEDFSRIINWLQGHSLQSLAQQSGGMPENLKQLASRLPAVHDEELDSLTEIEGLRIHRLVQNYDLLVVSLAHVEPSRLMEASSRLDGLGDNIVDISFAGQQLSDADWRILSAMPNLQRLDLRDSNTGNDNIKTLASLRRIEWLNLYGSMVDIDEKELKALLPSLQRVYLGRSQAVSASGGG